MAAQHSPRPNNQQQDAAAARTLTSPIPSAVPPLPRKVVLQDPEDIMLLREKLNQIAVGRRYSGDNQIEHMDESGGDDEYECGYNAARRRRPQGHFGVFLSTSERPSTPPSSPQPRDVLRKQLRMKNHRPLTTPGRSLSSEDNSSDTASDEPLDGMCIDGIEISPLAEHEDIPSHPSVRLSVPDHLRVVSSSYSILTKCPEGFRKRKSVHMDDRDLELVDDAVVAAPLKKVSSHVNVLTAAVAATSLSRREIADHDMEDACSSQTSVGACL